MKKELIKSIHIDKANLEHIAKTGNINGTLLIEIERVMEEYAKTCNKPAVNNSEGIEREAQLLAFIEYLNKNRVAKYTSAVVNNFLSQQ